MDGFSAKTDFVKRQRYLAFSKRGFRGGLGKLRSVLSVNVREAQTQGCTVRGIVPPVYGVEIRKRRCDKMSSGNKPLRTLHPQP